MLEKIKSKKYVILALLFIVILVIVFLLKESNQTVNTSGRIEEKKYKYISELIYNNESIIKIATNKNITDEEMKAIYDEYNKHKDNCKIWFYETEENAINLDIYNISEIKKENGKYKIHRYGEETEEEKAIRLEKERVAKEEEEKRKEEERLKKEEEEKARKEKEEAEEKARKEQEIADFKGSCKIYTFKEMARNPDTFKGTNVKLTGEVIQAMYGSYLTELRVNITKQGSYSTYYTDTIYVTYPPKEGEGKILEDDIITIWGTACGDTSYTSTLGATITLPYISAKYIEIK